MVAEQGRLPVVNFAAGGIATPADAALMMQLGADGVFVGSGIFKSADPAPRARAIVKATTHFNDPEILAKVSHGLGEPMQGSEIATLETRLQIAAGERAERAESCVSVGRGATVISQAYYYVVAAIGLIFLLGGLIGGAHRAAQVGLSHLGYRVFLLRRDRGFQRRRALVPRRARLRDPRRARALVASR